MANLVVAQLETAGRALHGPRELWAVSRQDDPPGTTPGTQRAACRSYSVRGEKTGASGTTSPGGAEKAVDLTVDES